jgi:hypothetical protein
VVHVKVAENLNLNLNLKSRCCPLHLMLSHLAPCTTTFPQRQTRSQNHFLVPFSVPEKHRPEVNRLPDTYYLPT